MPQYFAQSNQVQVEAQANPKAQGDSSIINPKVEKPFSIYKSITGKSYVQEFFKTNEDVSLIEEYATRQMEKRNLEDTKQSFDSLMKEIFDAIKVEENEKIESKMSKVIKYINLLYKNKSEEDKKRALLRRKAKMEEERAERKRALMEARLEREVKERKIMNEQIREREQKIKELQERNEILRQNNALNKLI